MIKWDLSRVASIVQYLQINVIHHITKTKDKNHKIVTTYIEKSYDKIQHPFMIKNSHQSGYRGNISQHNKGHL